MNADIAPDGTVIFERPFWHDELCTLTLRSVNRLPDTVSGRADKFCQSVTGHGTDLNFRAWPHNILNKKNDC